MTISQNAIDVRARALQGIVGALALAGGLIAHLTVINSDPQAAQVSSITITTATNSFTYIFAINGVNVSFTADASATLAEISAGLYAAIQAEPAVRGYVTPVDDGISKVTLTGTTPGLAFTVTEVSTPSKATIATATAAASAAAVPFGRMVIDGGVSPDGDPTRLGKLAAATAFSAQVSTLTVTYAANSDYTVTIRNPHTGETWVTSVPGDTNDNTTAANINAAINAMMPANTVISTVATNVVTLTAEVAGYEFEVVAVESGAGAGAIVTAHTTAASDATSLNRVARGVSMHSLADEAATIAATAGSYPANAGVRVLKNGVIWVDRPTTVVRGEAVFVELAAGANTGKFYNAASATRVRLGGAVWEYDGRTAADAISALRINL